jgi:DNA-binding HxlR family transcriptional regulator
MKSYGQYCPVARAFEVVGDRWPLPIVRDLLLANRGFNELERGLPGISRSLLAQRLRLLARGGVVARDLGPTAAPAPTCSRPPAASSLP